MRCNHEWEILDDCWLVKCRNCLEVRKHPTDKDDCTGHDFRLLEDGSGVYQCSKCWQLVGVDVARA